MSLLREVIMKKRSLKRLGVMLLALTMIVSSVYLNTWQVAAGTTTSYEEIVQVSQLPVININIENGEAPDKSNKEVKKNAEISITNTGGKDLTVSYSAEKGWPMTIKGRGNSSWTMPTNKKPYNIKFTDKQNLLGMGKAKKWCLVASWPDTSFMRNYLAYKLAKQLDENAPDCELVELCINGTYEGIYLLCEAAEIKDNRVVTADDGYDVTGDGVITEFLIESDSRAVTNDEPNRFQTNSGIWMVTAEPDEEDITSATDERFLYLQDYFNQVDEAIMNHGAYEDYIDVDSLINLYLVNEFAKNPDFGFGYQPCYSSTYMYMNEGGKLYFGPVWDFDIAFGRNDYKNQASEDNRDTQSPEGFLSQNTQWIKELFEDPAFEQRVKERWTEISPIIDHLIDTVAPEAIEKVSYTQAYDFATWEPAEQRSTSWNYRTPLAFEEEAAYVIEFMKNRQAWLDSQWLVSEKTTQYQAYWTRSEVDLAQVEAGTALLSSSTMQYADAALLNGTASLAILNLYQQMPHNQVSDGTGYIWDGGYGWSEKTGTEEVVYGEAQTAFSDVTLETPITITGPGGNISDWFKDDGTAKSGFGGNTKDITITQSGRYVYACDTKGWWFQNGPTYTMGENGVQIYVLDVSDNGSITLSDGAICCSEAGRVVTTTATTYGKISGGQNQFTLSYCSDQSGNAGSTLPGNGDVPFSIHLHEDFTGEALSYVKRPAQSEMTDPLKIESTYVYVEGVEAVDWTVTNQATGQPDEGEIVLFDLTNKKVTAHGDGTVIITAYSADGLSASVEVRSQVKVAEAIETVSDPTKGRYCQTVTGVQAEKGQWTTFANDSATRYTAFVELSEEQIQSATAFMLATRQKDQIIGGAATYYVYVNGQPFFRAGDNVLQLGGFAEVTLAACQDELSGYSRYQYMNGVHAHTDAVMSDLSAFLQAGANQIDIVVLSGDGGAMVKPYLFSSNSISGELPEKVTEIQLSPTALSLEAGDQAILTATLYPTSQAGKTVTWLSSNTQVASVTDGVVQAIGAGTATITARVDGVSASVPVTVTAKEEQTIAVTEIVAQEQAVTMAVGDQHPLVVKVYPENATNQNLSWKSGDEQIATVQDGIVTAVQEGTTTIYIYSEANDQVMTTVSVTVTSPTIPATGITLSSTALNLIVGQKATVSAQVEPENVTDQTLIWTSDHEEVATVDQGVIEAHQAGQAHITVTCGSVSATLTVTVSQEQIAVTDIQLSLSELNLEEGEQQTITATVLPQNATDQTLIWTSSNSNVVSVDNGVITAQKAGKATITVSSAANPEVSQTISVVVAERVVPLERIELSATELAMYETQVTTVTATLYPSDTTDRSIVWLSSNTAVATVKNGKISAVSAGEAIISAAVGDISATLKVTVTKKNVAAIGILVDPESAEMVVGDVIQAKATVLPNNADYKEVEWTSLDETIATVDGNGTIHAVGAGKTTIQVVSVHDNVKGTISITVTDPEPGSEYAAPVYDPNVASYPAGSVVYLPADGQYYVYTNAWGLSWTNSGALDSQWVQVTTDLSQIRVITGISTANIGEIVKIDNYYYTPLNNGSYTHWISVGKSNAYWNCIPTAISDAWN